jgi:hypothetical protein
MVTSVVVGRVRVIPAVPVILRMLLLTVPAVLKGP